MLETNRDKWYVGRMHEYLEHDCKFTLKGFCDVWERVETAYMEAKQDENKMLGNLFGDRTEGSAPAPLSVN